MKRTQGLLHAALASLIHEKAYDAIVVKEILARADVGRSTFYTHFRDKDQLLDSGIRDVLRAGEAVSPPTARAADRVLRFSLPILEHVERYRAAGDAALASGGQPTVHEHLERVLVELVAGDLRHAGGRRPSSERDVPGDLLARHVASTFLLVLTWWLAGARPLPAREVNDLFRALVLPAVTDAVGT